MKCTCPDYAGMCKHIAAVMYGIGARLDEKPDLLFLLRKVDHLELIAGAVDSTTAAQAGKPRGKKTIATADLADVFGIEMAEAETPQEAQPEAAQAPRNLALPRPRRSQSRRQSVTAAAAKKTAQSTAAKRTKPKASKKAATKRVKQTVA